MQQRTTPIPVQRPGTETERIAHLSSEMDALKSQLMNTSLINELTKVMHSSTDLAGITKTLLLGIQEILLFDRVILFEIDAKEFCLKPQAWVGLGAEEVRDLTVPLGFEGGEMTDAIFLNRHFIVEDPEQTTDPLSRRFASSAYLAIPLLSKATRRCWEHKNCGKTTCPAYGSYNPYCWSIPGSGEMLNEVPEDERRRLCIACSCFRCEGVIWMDRKLGHAPITSDDITTLTTVINQAGVLIENFRIFNALEKANTDLSDANGMLKRLNTDLQIAQGKIQNDLTHARTIQLGLLPQNLEDTSAFSIGARYIPATAVGGDYYDVFEIKPGMHGMIVADVSGHGIASALIMSMVKVLLKTNAANQSSPQRTLEQINEIFLSEVKTDNFVTIFYAIIDTTAGTLCYTSAGHCPILIYDKETRTAARVNADGLFLGVFPDMMLKEATRPYRQGRERIVLYTDGLTESHNADDEMFDLPRLEEIALRSLDRPPKKAVEDILEYQRAFCGPDRLPEDDITLLVIDL